MALPNVFATQPAGTVPASFLDANFNALGNGIVVPCTATGTNAIALTPLTNYPTITSYFNYGQFSFVAAANSTGLVTVNISGVGASNLYLPSGAQAGSGTIIAATMYVIAFNQALNTGSGGFQIVSVGAGGGTNPVLHEQLITGGGTFTIPSSAISTTAFKFTAVGGGGGGGGQTGTSGSVGGGGSGGGVTAVFTGFTGGTNVTIAIGTGGTGGTGGGGTAGGTGGVTTVTYAAVQIMTANGGLGSPSGGNGGGVGTASATAGASGLTLTATYGAGAQSGMGGGVATYSGAGGANRLGNGGNPATTVGSNGNAGTNGGGGSGSSGNGAGSFNGGAGGGGAVLVEWVL